MKTTGTINLVDIIEEYNGKSTIYEPMNDDLAQLYTKITLASFQDDNVFDIVDEMLASNETSIVHMIDKRIKAYNLIEYIDKSAMLFIELFAQGNPGKAMFMLTLFMNYYAKHNNKITWEIASSQIFPFGFIKDDILFNIIDNEIKTHKCLYHEIYNAI